MVNICEKKNPLISEFFFFFRSDILAAGDIKFQFSKKDKKCYLKISQSESSNDFYFVNGIWISTYYQNRMS